MRARLYSVATYLIVKHKIFISILEKTKPTPDQDDEISGTPERMAMKS